MTNEAEHEKAFGSIGVIYAFSKAEHKIHKFEFNEGVSWIITKTLLNHTWFVLQSIQSNTQSHMRRKKWFHLDAFDFIYR